MQHTARHIVLGYRLRSATLLKHLSVDLGYPNTSHHSILLQRRLSTPTEMGTLLGHQRTWSHLRTLELSFLSTSKVVFTTFLLKYRSLTSIKWKDFWFRTRKTRGARYLYMSESICISRQLSSAAPSVVEILQCTK